MLVAAGLLTTIPFGRAAWDFVFILDGAYRISLGQTPHIDFMSPVGSLVLYITAFVQAVSADVHPFVGMHVAVWLLMAPALAALAPRFSGTMGFLAALALAALMALLPMTLDSTHLSEISYFASYNRFATAFLFLIGLWLVLPKRRYDWALLAYLLLILFFLKVTAAVVGLGIVVAATILGRCNWRDAMLAVIALGGGLVAVQLATGLTVGYLADIRAMSAVNQGNVVYAIFFTGFRNWIPLAVTAALVVAVLYALRRDRRIALAKPFGAIGVFHRQESLVVDTVLLVGAAWAAESQNTGGLGLIAALAILFRHDAWQRHRLAMGLLMAALLFPVADIAVKRSITALSRERIAAPEQPLPGTRIPLSTHEGARLFERMAREWLPLAREVQEARFFLTHDPTSNATAAQLAWLRGVSEAARAFEANGYRDRATRYTTIAFSDPFAQLLGLTPAKGTALVMDVSRTIPDHSPEQTRAYLSGADGVFLERCDMASDTLETRFEPILRSGFEALPLTDCWELYIRRKED